MEKAPATRSAEIRGSTFDSHSYSVVEKSKFSTPAIFRGDGIFAWLIHENNFYSAIEKPEKKDDLCMFDLCWIAIAQNMCVEESADPIAQIASDAHKKFTRLNPVRNYAQILLALCHRMRLYLINGNHPVRMKLNHKLTAVQQSNDLQSVYVRELEKRREERKKKNPLYVAEVKRSPYLYEEDRWPEELKDTLLQYVYSIEEDAFEALCVHYLARIKDPVNDPFEAEYSVLAAWYLHWKQVFLGFIRTHPLKPLNEGPVITPQKLSSMRNKFIAFVNKRKHFGPGSGTQEELYELLLKLFAPVGASEFHRKMSLNQQMSEQDKIYQKVSSTLIWLEPSTKLSDVLVLTIREIADAKQGDLLDGKLGSSDR